MGRSERLFAAQTRSDDRGDDGRHAVHDRAGARHLASAFAFLRLGRDRLGRSDGGSADGSAAATAASTAAAATGVTAIAAAMESGFETGQQPRPLAAIVARIAGVARSRSAASRSRRRAANRLSRSAARLLAAAARIAAVVALEQGFDAGAEARSLLATAICCTTATAATATTTAAAANGSGHDRGLGRRSSSRSAPRWWGRRLARQPCRGQHEIRGIHDNSSWGRSV